MEILESLAGHTKARREVEIPKGKCVGREQNRAQDRAHFEGESDKLAGRSKKSQKRRKKGSAVLEYGLMESRERCVSRSKWTSMLDVAGMSNTMTGKCQVNE